MSLFLRKNGFDLLEKDFDTLFSFKNVNGMLKTNVEEKENEYEFTVEVPGIEKKDINITLENGYLSIVATKNYSEEKNYIRKEIREGKYSRAFYIGNECDEENVKASFENGLLFINIPKKVEKENIWISSNEVDETGAYYTEWSKPEGKT